jgi:hypothetical protein
MFRSFPGVRRAVLALLGLLLATAVGCEKLSAPPSRVRFNDQIARNIKQIGKQAVALRKVAQPENTEDPVNTANIKSESDKLKQLVEKLNREAEDMQLPRNPSGTETRMLEKYKDFIKDQQRIFDKYVTQYVRIAEDTTLPKKKRDDLLGEQIDLIRAEESKTKAPLETAQADLAKERNFQPVFTKR